MDFILIGYCALTVALLVVHLTDYFPIEPPDGCERSGRFATSFPAVPTRTAISSS